MKSKKPRKLLFGMRKKALVYTTLILGVAFGATFTGINRVVKQNMYASLSKQYSYINDKILLAVGYMYEELDQMTSNFIFNEYVQKTLTNKRLTAGDLVLLEKTLSYYKKSYLDEYIVIDNKENFYSSKTLTLDTSTFKNGAIYKSLGGEYSTTKIIWERDTLFGSYEMNFFVVRYIRAMESEHEPGVVVLRLNDGILNQVKANIENEELIYLILDGNGQICFEQTPKGYVWDQSTKNQIGEMVKGLVTEDSMFQSYHKGIITAQYDENTEFTIITYAPVEVTQKVIREVQIILEVIFCMSYGITCLGIFWFTKKLTNPIKLLSDTMTGFDDTKLDHTIHFSTNTELDYIGEAYNKMLGEVNSLMEAVKEKEAELRKSELNTLMYQIRPHFLYNTLDNIYMLARIQKEEIIMKMIQSLSKLLRFNLNNGKEDIEVEKELEYVSSYLDIEKIRNADSFDYSIECEESVRHLPVMKMILQPITENCIKYGVADIYEGIRIQIRVSEEDEYLCFVVENNGAPIDSDQMEKLNRLEVLPMEEIADLIRRKDGGFGISNVVRRLRLKYDDQIRFYYERLDPGTACTIKVKKSRLITKEKE